MLIPPEHLNSPQVLVEFVRVAQFFVFCVMFYRSLYFFSSQFSFWLLICPAQLMDIPFGQLVCPGVLSGINAEEAGIVYPFASTEGNQQVLCWVCVVYLFSCLWSLRSEFHVVMSFTMSASKRCSVLLYLQLFLVGLMSYLRHLCLVAYIGVQHIFFFRLCFQFLWIFYLLFPFVIFWCLLNTAIAKR